VSLDVLSDWDKRNGKIKHPAIVAGEDYWVYGQVTVNDKFNLTYRIFDETYSYEMHSGYAPKTIIRNIATFIGSPPGTYVSPIGYTPFKIHYEGPTNLVGSPFNGYKHK
jgi:hypothetical protein